ncbi:hypothetical protein N0V90_013187 [Kalmusia sp. IMI 367209]|nr:hypothetical protein N0V90_013187 [Kalmusia sp. IMI 367209]
MDGTRDTSPSNTPPKPAFRGVDTASVTGSGSTPMSVAKKSVEDPLYRYRLVSCNIYMRTPGDDVPKHISDLIGHIRRHRNSPSPSRNDIWKICNGEGLHELEDGATKSVQRQMNKDATPYSYSQSKLSTPFPDLLYGYQLDRAFPQQQALALKSATLANNDGLMFPFLLVEVKGDGGSMYGATNQCLGGSASCVNIAETLNWCLKQQQLPRVYSAVFSIAMNGTEARVYISWKASKLDWYMQKIEHFVLHRATDYEEFQKIVQNIFDWGRGHRLDEIRKALDALQKKEEDTKQEEADEASGLKKRKYHHSP